MTYWAGVVKRTYVVLAIVFALSSAADEIFLEGIEEPLATLASAAYASALESEVELSAEYVANRWGELGMLLQAHNLHEQTIVAYSNALSKRSDPRWLYLRSIAYGELGRVQEAIDDLNEVTISMREVAIIWYRLGQALLNANRVAEAKSALSKALSLDGKLAIAHMALADAHMLAGDFAKAKTSLQQAYRLQPDAGQVVYRLAQVERELGNEKASQTWLERRTNQFAPSIEDPMLAMVAQYSTNPTFFISAARRAWERGDTETALGAYRRAIELAPQNVDNLIGYAQLLKALQRYDDTLKVLDALEAISPREVMLWYLRAEVHLSADRVLAAQKAIKQAVALNPTEQVLALEKEISELRKFDRETE